MHTCFCAVVMLHKHPPAPSCTQQPVGHFWLKHTHSRAWPTASAQSATSTQPAASTLHDLSYSHALLTPSSFNIQSVNQSAAAAVHTETAQAAAHTTHLRLHASTSCYRAAGTASDRQIDSQADTKCKQRTPAAEQATQLHTGKESATASTPATHTA
jgi:hypothetical protein